MIGVRMYTYDSMLLILKAYRRIGQKIHDLQGELEVYNRGYAPQNHSVSIHVKGGKHKDISNRLVDVEQVKEELNLLYKKHDQMYSILDQFGDQLIGKLSIKADICIIETRAYILDICIFLGKINSRKNKKYIPIFTHWVNCKNIVIPNPYEVM